MKYKKKTVSQKNAQHTNEGKMSFLLPALMCISSVYVAVLLMIYTKMNAVQPIPYLDEIYHVPQAQEYCRGNFSYVSV